MEPQSPYREYSSFQAPLSYLPKFIIQQAQTFIDTKKQIKNIHSIIYYYLLRASTRHLRASILPGIGNTLVYNTDHCLTSWILSLGGGKT